MDEKQQETVADEIRVSQRSCDALVYCRVLQWAIQLQERLIGPTNTHFFETSR